MKLSITDNYIIEKINTDVDFFISNPISKLINVYRTSESTIIRLSKKLGYNSIRDWKLDLIKEESLKQLTDVSNDQKGVANIVNNVSAFAAFSVINSKKLINIYDLEKIINEILIAKHINIFGIGNSYFAAEFLSKQLNKIGLFNSIGSTTHHAAVQVNFSSENDICIIFSDSGRTKELYWICKVLKKKNIPIILITSNMKADNKLLNFAMYKVQYSVNEKDDNSLTSISARIGQFFIATLLFESLLQKVPNSEEKLESSATLTQQWNEES